MLFLIPLLSVGYVLMNYINIHVRKKKLCLHPYTCRSTVMRNPYWDSAWCQEVLTFHCNIFGIVKCNVKTTFIDPFFWVCSEGFGKARRSLHLQCDLELGLRYQKSPCLQHFSCEHAHEGYCRTNTEPVFGLWSPMNEMLCIDTKIFGIDASKTRLSSIGTLSEGIWPELYKQQIITLCFICFTKCPNFFGLYHKTPLSQKDMQ